MKMRQSPDLGSRSGDCDWVVAALGLCGILLIYIGVSAQVDPQNPKAG